jgi:hypothetical protein
MTIIVLAKPTGGELDFTAGVDDNFEGYGGDFFFRRLFPF